MPTTFTKKMAEIIAPKVSKELGEYEFFLICPAGEIIVELEYVPQGKYFGCDDSDYVCFYHAIFIPWGVDIGDSEILELETDQVRV